MMFKSKGICNFNLTIILVNYQLGLVPLFDKQTGKFRGPFAFLTKYLLGSLKCKLIAIDKIGEEYNNGSQKITTGAIDLLAKNMGDLVFKMTSYYKPQSNIFKFTQPTVFQSQIVTHQLSHLDFVQSNKNLIELVSLDINFLIFYNLMIGTFYIFFKISLKEKFRKFLNYFLMFGINRLHSNISYFMIQRFGTKISKLQIFNLFIIVLIGCLINYIGQKFVICSFQISQIVLDKKDIIYSTDQMMKSNRFWCYFETEETVNLFKNAPKGSLQNQIYTKKLNKDCPLDFSKIAYFNNEKYKLFRANGFAIGNEGIIHIFTNFLSNFQDFWISKEFFGLNLANLIRKKLNDGDKKFFIAYLSKYLEIGLVDYVFRSTTNLSKNFNKGNGGRVYDSFESIKNDRKFISSNNFEQFKSTGLLLFGSQLTILIVFFLHKFVIDKIKFSKKSLFWQFFKSNNHSQSYSYQFI